ncbi:MAG: Mammalian cell entry related domain protein [candidate division TM6 bacterium GW2011_GWF2_30_66]|nr:MAG: Mammalian cell entry related domain protein [candidate division TM6 bacterium GW2011_GWF2_30_66]
MRGKIETQVGIFVIAAIGVLIYMGFHIGAFRFDINRYANYKIYFKDVSGLSRKAEVRVAGVKVGWLEKLEAVSDGELRVRAYVMILKDFVLYSDAYAMIRQDGLLGTKFIEIVPGDPLLRKLSSGDTLSKPSVSPVSTDEILQQVKDIAAHVQDVTKSFRAAIGGEQGESQLRSIFNNINEASSRFASMAEILDRNLSNNQGKIEEILNIGESINRVASKLDESVFPAFKDGIEKISNVFDNDFSKVAERISDSTESLNEALSEARDGLKHISSISEKIDDGKGLLGKLINEDETYKDIKFAVSGIKNYFAKIDKLQILFDSHFETMYRPAENYRYEDSKGYFDIRINPNEDYFYKLELATSQKGFIERKERLRSYADQCGNTLDTCSMKLDDWAKLQYVYRRRTEKIQRNTVKLGLQFGKIFGPVAVRFGLFEGSSGIGVDFDIPFSSDKFRWVTSFEGFDFIGWNRLEDRRPHLKWINKIYVMRNLYMTFGADDFISKHNSNAFFGAGIRFGDDDIKYFASSIGGLSGVGSMR